MDRDDLEKMVKRAIKRIENYGTPDVCWPWTGKKSQPRTRVRRTFSLGQPINLRTQIDRPYGSIKYQGKYLIINRVVYEYLNPSVSEVELPWRVINSCGNTLCCNPEHWDFVVLGLPKENKKSGSDEQPPSPEDTLKSDCQDLLDQIFSVGGPATLQEVLEHVYMIDFPRELIIKLLHEMGKGHIVNGN